MDVCRPRPLESLTTAVVGLPGAASGPELLHVFGACKEAFGAALCAPWRCTINSWLPADDPLELCTSKSNVSRCLFGSVNVLAAFLLDAVTYPERPRHALRAPVACNSPPAALMSVYCTRSQAAVPVVLGLLQVPAPAGRSLQVPAPAGRSGRPVWCRRAAHLRQLHAYFSC